MTSTSKPMSRRTARRPLLIPYLRVSTPQQEALYGRLYAQLMEIKAHAAESSLKLHPIPCSDVSSAWRGNSLTRTGYRDAIKQAVAFDAGIIVTSADRLSRNVAALAPLFEKSIPVFSVEAGGRLSKRDLVKQVRAAERKAKEIAQSNISSQRTKWHSGPTRDQRMQGAANNLLRADEKARFVAEFVLKNPQLLGATWAGRVHALNAAGVLNLQSLTRGFWKEWTVEALRAFWHRVVQEMDIQASAEAAD